MAKNSIIVSFILAFILGFSHIVVGQRIFSKTFGQYDFNTGKDVLIEGNNYYILSNSGLNNGNSAPMILKMDSIGRIVKIGYSPIIGIVSANRFVKQATKFYTCGTIQNTLTNDYDAFLSISDTSFETLKTIIFGGTAWDFGQCIAISDTLVFVGGKSFSTANGFASGVISKFNTNGDSLATYYFGLDGEASIESLIIRGDSELIYTGTYQAPDSAISAAFVVCSDFNGAIHWRKNLSADLGKSIGSDLTKGADNRIAICGTTEKDEATSMKDAFVYVLYGNGDYRNHLIFGINCPESELFTSISATDEGDYYLCGNTKCIGAGANDVYLFKTNADGWWSWSTSYGSENEDYGAKILYQPADSGFVMVGSSIDIGNFNTNILVIKTDKSLSLDYHPTHEVSVPDNAGTLNFSVFPNPVHDIISIQGETESIQTVEIMDISGRLLALYPKNRVSNRQIDISQFPAQILFLKINTSKGVQVVKLIKQ